MKYKTLENVKEGVREAINSQNIKKFGKLVWDCPIMSGSTNTCAECALQDKEGPIELLGPSETCLVGLIRRIYADYSLYKETSKEATMARLILESIKLLAYLDNKE